MELVDDRGRVGGRINVVDALVVLVTAAIGVAGLALVGIGTPGAVAVLAVAGFTLVGLAVLETPTGETTRARLDFGEQPQSVARRILGGETDLAIVDVFVTPGEDGVRTLAVVEFDRRPLEDRPTYGGTAIAAGETLSVRVGGRDVRASVEETGPTATIDRTTERVLVRATLPVDVALEAGSGDRWMLAGREVATVESVTRYRTADPTEIRAFVGLSVEALVVDDTAEFAGRTLRIGTPIPVETGGYVIEGQIVRRNAIQERGDPVACTVRARIDADAATRDALAAGAEETIEGDTVAAVVSVATVDRGSEPVEGKVRTDGGGETCRTDGTGGREEYCTDGGIELTLELSARRTDTGLRFKGDPLELGTEIPLSFERVTITPTAVGIEEIVQQTRR